MNSIAPYAERPELAASPNAVTLLRSKRIPMTKVYGPGLKKVKPYSNAANFTPWVAAPSGIEELSAVLMEASQDRCLCVVRGQLIDPKVEETTRDKKVIKDTPRQWLMVDLDGFVPPPESHWLDDPGRAAEWAVSAFLPEPFHNAAFHYQFSSSAGIKRGLRLHLWFWLAAPATSDQLKKYFKPIRKRLLALYNPEDEPWTDDEITKVCEMLALTDLAETGPIPDFGVFPSDLDIAIYDSIQIHYCAVPEFAVAGDDPFAAHPRQGLCAGGHRTLTVVLPEVKADGKDWVPSERDLKNMIPALILHYPKLVDEWDRTYPSPWKRAMTAFRHHLVKVLNWPDDDAFALVEREFNQKLSGYTSAMTEENRRQWNNSAIDLPPGEGGQITVWTLVKWAEAEGYRPPAIEREGADIGFIHEWRYVVAIKRFVNTKTLLEYDREQFDAVFLSYFTKGQPYDLVLRNSLVQTINAMTYFPNQKRFVEEDAFATGTPELKLNYWNPPIIKPSAGEVQPFLDHIKYLYPDPVKNRPDYPESEILLDYLAFQVQHPGEKIHWAILLQGEPGTGKSYFSEPLKKALGPWNVKEISSAVLHQQFNGWQKNCQVIIVEEMMARGRLELMNKLKPQITQPWHEIREMYKPHYWIPNRFNFIFLTNHKDAILIDKMDRRYCVLATKATPHPNGIKGYYKPLFDWTHTNGPALLHWLKHHKFSQHFEPKGHAPKTEGRQMMVEESMTPLQSFIHRRVQDHEWPFNVDIVSPDEIAEKVLPKFNLREAPAAVGKAFASLGYTPLGYRRFGEKRQDGEHEQMNLWAVRNAETYENLSTQEVRTKWLAQIAWINKMLGEKDDPADYPKILEAAREKGIPDPPALNVVAETEPMSTGNLPPRVDRSKRKVQ